MPTMNPKTIRLRTFLRATLTVAAVIISSITWANPPEGVLDQTHASVRAVMAVQAEVTPELMRWPYVLGTSVGVDDCGTAAFAVYVGQGVHGVSECVRVLP